MYTLLFTQKSERKKTCWWLDGHQAPLVLSNFSIMKKKEKKEIMSIPWYNYRAYTMHHFYGDWCTFLVAVSSRLSISKAHFSLYSCSSSCSSYNAVLNSLLSFTCCRSRCLVTSHRLHKPWGWLIARNESYPLSRAKQTRPSYSHLGCWWW